MPSPAQGRGSDPSPAEEAPPSVHRALAQPGRPLDSGLRSDIEARFGHGFSNVRIHDDAEAAEAAADIDADAFTAGRDVLFAQGRFAPESGDGRRLLVHELAHVVQQGDGDGTVVRRQGGGKKRTKKKHVAPKAAAPAKKASEVGGEIAEGDPLSAAELAQVQEAGAKVPARFRRYVAYKDEIKVGGSLAWRFNNPGNLRSSGKQLTQLKGGAGKFAVFKDMATGREAQRDLYLNTYGKMSVRAAIEKLTPRSENDTSAYLKALARGGVDLDKDVASQIDTLMREVEKNEGLIEGSTLPRGAASPHARKKWRGIPYALPEPDAPWAPWTELPWFYPDDR